MTDLLCAPSEERRVVVPHADVSGAAPYLSCSLIQSAITGRYL